MRLAVTGSPVTHSLSPVIHRAALDACGIPGTYEAIDCDADGFAVVLDSIRDGELDGCNVTMPHKRLAARLVDRLDPLAARCGAVNTVVRVGDELVGHNTDVEGIRVAWGWAGLGEEAPVLVLGSGGAAAAALLATEGRELSITARRPEAARRLTAEVAVDAAVVDWGMPVTGAIVVNATPIGMHGDSLPEPVLAGAAGLFEMPYGAQPTPAMVEMTAKGRPIAPGVDMLLAQALAAFRLWTGRTPPLAPIREAL